VRSRLGYQIPSGEVLSTLRKACDRERMFLGVEVGDISHLEAVTPVAELVQVAASQMQNYGLLAALGASRQAVLLDRGASATFEELLLSAEAMLSAGNPNILLGERGIRGFDTAASPLMDIGAIPAAHRLSHLPVVADPMRGSGRKKRVLPLARAAVAAGVDALILELGAEPGALDEFRAWLHQVWRMAAAVNRV